LAVLHSNLTVVWVYQVSATFAASMVTSPAIGAYLGSIYGDGLVVALATAVAVLDIFFILVAVPESLSETRHPEAYHLNISQVSWERADPFGVSLYSYLSAAT
jgi:hypothetical protein